MKLKKIVLILVGLIILDGLLLKSVMNTNFDSMSECSEVSKSFQCDNEQDLVAKSACIEQRKSKVAECMMAPERKSETIPILVKSVALGASNIVTLVFVYLLIKTLIVSLFRKSKKEES